MISQPTKIETLQRDFAGLTSQAMETGAQLERGQAECPISEAFRDLLESTTGQTLVVSVACLSPTSKKQMLRWMTGEDAERTVLHQAPERPIILRINPIGLSVQSSDVATEEQRDILISGRNEDRWHNVQVVIAHDLKQLRDKAHVYQQFCTTGHLLLVAGEPDLDLSDHDIELLSDLAGAFEAVWTTVLGEKSASLDGWWQHALFRSHTGAMEALWLDPRTFGGGEVLSEASNPLRDALLFEPRARTLQGAIGNLADRQDRELNALKLRQSLLESQPKAPNPRDAHPVDKQVAQVRERFSDELSKLEKEINLKSERATQPLGKLTNLMRENVSKLRLEDLDKQQSPSLIKLSVNGSHLGTVNRTIEHALRQELTVDTTTVRQRLNELVTNSTETLQDAVGDDAAFLTPPFSEGPIWRTVENLMAIGKESHIELARKGVFDVLTAGRQKVFILIMFVSLMGRMGLPNLFATGLARTGFGLFMVSVLIGSMANAIFVWRREKESQSDKEMAKIKDSLFADGTKVIEQVEKGKLNYLRDYLRDFNKSFDQQLKRAIEEYGTRRKAEIAAQSQRYEASRKMLDAQVKTSSDVGRQIGKLADNAKKLHAAAISEIRVAARGHKPLSPTPPDTIESSPPNTDSVEAVAADQVSATPTTEQELLNAAAAAAATPGVPPLDSVAEPETEPPQPKHDEPPARRPSALMQRREARRRARLAQQSVAAKEQTDEKEPSA